MKLIHLTSFACGTIFSLGLIQGKMIDPASVLAFLDLRGEWKPALIFVLAGAFAVALGGIQTSRYMKRPLLDATFRFPTAKTIDRNLIIGSMLFGLGWGLVGFCPGPAVAALLTGNTKGLVFLASLLIGMAAFSRWSRRR
ncbi:YeeE/YedE family protein [Asaia siamensis]